MATWEEYREAVREGFIEDDVGLHAFNLMNRPGVPGELQALCKEYVAIEIRLKAAFKEARLSGPDIKKKHEHR